MLSRVSEISSKTCRRIKDCARDAIKTQVTCVKPNGFSSSICSLSHTYSACPTRSSPPGCCPRSITASPSGCCPSPITCSSFTGFCVGSGLTIGISPSSAQPHCAKNHTPLPMASWCVHPVAFTNLSRVTLADKAQPLNPETQPLHPITDIRTKFGDAGGSARQGMGDMLMTSITPRKLSPNSAP